MLHKTMIALFTAASVGMLAPSVTSARGGFGGGGFRSGAIGSGGFHSAAIGSRGFRSAAIESGGFRDRAFAANGFRGGGFHHGFHHHGRRFAFGAFAVGLGNPYAYYGDYDYDYPYDYANDDSYYGDSGCYVVQRRVHTRYGWRVRPVQVCG